MTGVEGAEQQRGGKEKMRKEREKERERGEKRKGVNGFMQSYKHMSGVFWSSSGYILGENKCKEQSGEVEEEEELRYLNPVWVSSRPWTS